MMDGQEVEIILQSSREKGRCPVRDDRSGRAKLEHQLEEELGHSLC